MTDEEQTAFNIACDNEKLWFGRLLECQRERDQVKAECAALKRELTEIEAEHQALQDKHRRLQTEFERQETRLVIAATLRRHLDPFLPEDLQDQEQRAAMPAVYENVKSRFVRF